MRPVWIWGQSPHLLRVVGEAAFPVIQVEGQFDSLTVALGDEEVQKESRGTKKKIPESSYKAAGSVQERKGKMEREIGDPSAKAYSWMGMKDKSPYSFSSGKWAWAP